MAVPQTERPHRNNNVPPLYTNIASTFDSFANFPPPNSQAQQNDMDMFTIGQDSDASGLFAGFNPMLSGPDTIFGSESRPTHVDPMSMWPGAPNKFGMQQDMAVNSHMTGLGDLINSRSRTVSEHYGQITPPDDHPPNHFGKVSRKRMTAHAAYDFDNAVMSGGHHRKQSSIDSSASKKQRRDSRISPDESEEPGFETGDRKDKYREKNRVAAAKCRAKKKEHVDSLEDTHRTQSVLNAALKSTEKSLRDELSFWRTQALQHTFCSCHSIQDYNMRQAKNLAGQGSFGNNFGSRFNGSPTMVSAASTTESPVTRPASQRDPRSQSIVVQSASPVAVAASSSAVTPVKRPLSREAEQELKNFIEDTAE